MFVCARRAMCLLFMKFMKYVSDLSFSVGLKHCIIYEFLRICQLGICFFCVQSMMNY